MKKFIITLAVLATTNFAATVAYWRFEDGANGVESFTYLDLSGNGSTMTNYGATGTGDIPWGIVPQTVQANTLAAEYKDTASNAGDYLSTDGSQYIDTLDFTDWTIEATFKFHGNTNWGVHARPGIVCKEGNNASYPYLNLQLDENNKLRVVTSRSQPAERRIYGTTTLESGKWYSVAVTYEGSASGTDREAELYLKGEGDSSYNREGGTSGPWSGIGLQGDEPWTIGRGFRDGNGKGYFDGIIDEVKISNEILPQEQFLGAPVEPGVTPETIAYWRFEEGTAGWSNPDYRQDVYLDASPNENHLWVYEAELAPEYTADIPFEEVPQSGSTNTLALKFSLFDELYARWKSVNTNTFSSGWTVECMAKFDSYGYQVLVNKDGRPDITFGPSVFQLKFRDDTKKLELAFFDGSGTYRPCSSSVINTGIWYFIAAVCDGSTAKLYMKEKDDVLYTEVASVSGISGGALYQQDSFWSVGRGMYKGGIANWLDDGYIDEVRLTDGELPPMQFLGSVVPEPGFIIGILAFVFIVFRRKINPPLKGDLGGCFICLIFVFSAFSSFATTNIVWEPERTAAPNGGYPRMEELSDGSLMWAAARGGPVLFALRSYDGGSNWTDETIVGQTKPGHDFANSFPIQLPNSNILYACRNNTPLGGDNWIYRLPVYESTDMGKSWHYYSMIEEETTVWEHSFWEPFFLLIPDGTLHVYYADININGISMKMSYDNGLNWSNKISVCPAPNRDKSGGMPGVVRLNDGKLICVFESGEEADIPPPYNNPQVAIRAVVSTNDGYAWYSESPSAAPSAIVYYPRNSAPSANASAPYIARMSDGTLFVSFQTDEDVTSRPSGYSPLDHVSFKYVTSTDNGATWSTNPVHLMGSETDPALWNAIFISKDDTLYGISGRYLRIGREAP